MTDIYFLSIYADDLENFLNYIKRNGFPDVGTSFTPEFGTNTYRVSLRLTSEQASSLRLSFNFRTFFNLNKQLDRQVERRSAKLQEQAEPLTNTELP